MNSIYSAWLPDNAINKATIENAINNCLNLWCSEWFSEKQLSIKKAKRTISNVATSEKQKLNSKNSSFHTHLIKYWYSDDLSLIISENGLLTIAANMVNQSLDYKKLRSSDLSLLKELSQEAIKDLHKRITLLFSLDTKTWDQVPNILNTGAYYIADITDSQHKKIFQIEVSKSLIISLIKLSAAQPRPSLPLEGMHKAISDQSINLSPQVGTTKLKLSEIRDLSIGDIISLETKTDALLDIEIDGSVITKKAAELKFEDNISIEIKREIVQW